MILVTFLRQVCDGTTSAGQPCDELCGGAGCGKCGGLSCLNGALTKAEGAVKSAESADKMLVEKDRKAERVLIDITKVQQKSQAAADNAQVLCLFLRHFLMYGRDEIVGSNLNPVVL